MFLNQSNNQNDFKPEYYCCPYCQREILQTNQQTHEARCERMQQESQNIIEQPQTQRQTSQRTQNRQQQQSQPQPQLRQPNIEPQIRNVNADPIMNPPIRRQSSRRQNDNSDLIPCEFCDRLIKMDTYGEHVQQCQASAEQQQQQQQQQAQIQERQAPQRRTHQRASSQRSQLAPPRQQERVNERGFFEEGFPGEFFSFGNGLQQGMMPRQQRQQQRSGGLFGFPFGSMMNNNQEDEMEIEQPQGHSYVRTVESLPNGAVIVRTNMVPRGGNQQRQRQQQQQQMQMQMEEEQPSLGGLFGNLFQMLGGQNGLFGQLQFGGGGDGGMQEQQRGLSKEIIDSLAVTKYDKKKNAHMAIEEKSCPICLEEFENGDKVKFLWCLHRFHAKCVDTWLEKNSTCPTCKKDYSEAERFGSEEH